GQWPRATACRSQVASSMTSVLSPLGTVDTSRSHGPEWREFGNTSTRARSSSATADRVHPGLTRSGRGGSPSMETDGMSGHPVSPERIESAAEMLALLRRDDLPTDPGWWLVATSVCNSGLIGAESGNFDADLWA